MKNSFHFLIAFLICVAIIRNRETILNILFNHPIAVPLIAYTAITTYFLYMGFQNKK